MKKKRKARKTARKKSAKRTTRKTARRKAARRSTRKAARRKTAKRATRKKARKKVAKRATRKVARKRVAKRAPKKTARKKTAKRKAAPKKKAAPRKAAPKTVAKAAKPTAKAKAPRAARSEPAAPMALVPERKAPARKPAKPAPRADDRTTKESALFDMMRARAVVLAAIEGLDASSSEQPLAEGKWTAREVVLHLAARDRARLREMESVLRGSPASWWAYDDDEQAQDNAEAIAATNHMRWEEAVDYLLSTRRELLESLESVPESPAEVWTPEHNFGRMIYGLPKHDRHHAEAIQRWRDEQGV